MTDSTDRVSGKSGLTLTITASKDGAAFASITPTVTDLGSGWYNLAMTTSHTDTLGDLALHITGSGADPTDLLIQIVAYDFANAISLGITRIDTTIGGRMGPAENAAILAEFALVKAKTDNLPIDPASETTVSTIETLIGTPAGASVSVDVASIKSDSGGLRTDITTARADKLDNLDVPVSEAVTAGELPGLLA